MGINHNNEVPIGFGFSIKDTITLVGVIIIGLCLVAYCGEMMVWIAENPVPALLVSLGAVLIIWLIKWQKKRMNDKRFSKGNINEDGDIDFASTIINAVNLVMVGWIFRKELWSIIQAVDSFWITVIFLAITNIIVFRKRIADGVRKFKKMASSY